MIVSGMGMMIAMAMKGVLGVDEERIWLDRDGLEDRPMLIHIFVYLFVRRLNVCRLIYHVSDFMTFEQIGNWNDF